jgi:HSP20 family molecular chaperone IbpA
MMMPSVWENNFFDDWFGVPFFEDKDMKDLEKKLYGRRGKNIMSTDVKETKDGYELTMDLPGFTKEEISVQLENGYLTVKAAKSITEDKSDKETKYVRKERCEGACQRSFYVGDRVEPEDIKADFKHGVLKLDLVTNKPEPEKKNTFIQIAG